MSLLAFYLFLVVIALVLEWGQFTRKSDTLIHDIWVQLGAMPPPHDVTIVGIDSKSLEAIGRWPWSRDIQARLIKKLNESGASSLTLDILFTETDNQLARNDQLLSAAIAQGSTVLPLLTGEYSAGKVNPEKLPIPEILMSVAGLGHVYLPVDPDGIVRRVNLKSGFKEAHWSTLALATATAIGQAPEELPGERIPPGPIEFSWVSDYQVYIPFYGGGGSIPTISAVDVLNGSLHENALVGKHIFVGVTAVGLGDIQPTPVSSNNSLVPGVEIHATIFSALRDNLLVTRAKNTTGYVLTAVLLLLVIFIYSRFSPGLSLLGSLILVSIPIAVSFVLYERLRLWYPPLSASIPILISLPLWSWHRLEFVSRFMQNEIDAMDLDIPPVTTSSNLSLVSYFNTAMEHLPLQGWSITSQGKLFQNGLLHEGKYLSKSVGSWTVKDNHYYKLYRSDDNLAIYLNISESQYAVQITDMVDSLARVRDRLHTKAGLDAVERLQIKAQKFSSRIENLRRLNTLSDSIFHGSPAGLVVWNIAGEFVVMNELAYEMFPEPLNSEPSFNAFIDAIGRGEDPEDLAMRRAVLLEKTPWQIDYNLEGEEKIIDFSVIGDRFADRLLVGSMVDVSHIRKSKRAQAEVLEYLSHDLRSPLVSSVYLLSMHKDKLEGQDVEGINRIEENINKSLGMIDDLLSLSRAENLKVEELEPLLFDNVVNNSIDELMPQAQGKKIALSLISSDDDLWVNGNSVLLERALTNIIGNAIKYSESNTKIIVQVDAKSEQLHCQIEDQGIGMDSDKVSVMFERFKRAGSVERSHQGTGLGLALVVSVIEQHNGKVWAFSAGKGEGMTVTFTLPLAILD